MSLIFFDFGAERASLPKTADGLSKPEARPRGQEGEPEALPSHRGSRIQDPHGGECGRGERQPRHDV